MTEETKTTIYLVTAGSYSDYHIVGAFSTKALAEAMVKSFNVDRDSYDEAGVEEHVLDTQVPGLPLWDVVFEPETLDVKTVSRCNLLFGTVWVSNRVVYNQPASDVADAIKRATDRFRQYLAEGGQVKPSLVESLRKLNACEDACEWAASYSSPEEAWAACPRGDWMLWLLGKIPSTRRQDLVLAACACARLALPYVTPGEDRPRVAIETAEAWARGAVGLDAVRVAVYDADAACAAAAADAACAAACAACAAAYAACAAAYAPADAVYSAAAPAAAAAAANAAAAAANAAAAAADAADAAVAAVAARLTVQARCADIVRRFFPKPPVLA